MAFSSLIFIFYFLSAVMVLYFIVPRRFKNGVLLLFSLGFYSWGEPKYAILMIGTLTFTYAAGRWIQAKRGTRGDRWRIVFSVAVPLGLLATFKYTNFLVENANALLGVTLPIPKLALPIGISFYTFQALSYLVDVHRGDVPAQKSWVDLATYITFFPQLIAGPIVRYSDIEDQLQHRTTTLESASEGARRFVFGLGKKVLLANLLGELCLTWRDAAEPSVLFAWIYAIAFSMQLYLDFSAYSDMAIGLGKIFGFHFPENFNYPYLSRSITDFWRRWHMTLGQWFRDYVYIPLGGSRKGTRRTIVNLLIVWCLTGFWHGAGWTFMLWGLWFGVLLIGEKSLWGRALGRSPKIVQHVYVLLAVIFSFVLFNAATLTQAGQDLAAMFGFAGLPFVTAGTLYILRSYGVVLLVSLIAVTPLWKKLGQRIGRSKVAVVLEPLAIAVVLLLCTGELADGSFNPFLYTRF